ncbi:unnamed protein product [Schistosoma haematobium]|nr:unnamed protein product [Schistosoma haematobium]CAH8435616.1 unnamed protein product [Schistosoma haematobium]
MTRILLVITLVCQCLFSTYSKETMLDSFQINLEKLDNTMQKFKNISQTCNVCPSSKKTSMNNGNEITTTKGKLKTLSIMDMFHRQRLLTNIHNSTNALQTTIKRNYDNTHFYSVTFKEADCYLHNPSMHLYEIFNVQFSFRTSQENGLLLFNSNKQGVDFIAFELIRSYLNFAFDMGSGSQHYSLTMYEVTDSRWHHVELSRIDLENNTLQLYIDRYKFNEQSIMIPVINGDTSRNFNLNDPLFIGGTPQYTFLKWREKLNSYHGFQGCFGNFSINGLPAYNLLNKAKQKYISNWTIPVCYDQIIPGCFERPNYALNCNEIQRYPKHHTINRDGKKEKLNSQMSKPYCLNDGLCLHSWTTNKCACELTSFEGDRCTRAGTTFLYGSNQDQRINVNINNWTMTTMSETIGYLRFMYKDRLRNTRKDEFTLGIQMLPMKSNSKSSHSIFTIATLLFITNLKQTGDFIHLFLESDRLKLNYDMGGGIIHIIGPNLPVNDGFYHRIRGYRLDHRVILEVDNTRQMYEVNRTYGKSFNNQEVIWIGHAPTLNKTDIFHGYMTGVYYNGLLLNDLAAGLSYLPFIQVARFGKVEYVPTFQPLLPTSRSVDELISFESKNVDIQSTSNIPADSATTYINQDDYNKDVIKDVLKRSSQSSEITNSILRFPLSNFKNYTNIISNDSSNNNNNKHTDNINQYQMNRNKWNLKDVNNHINIWLLTGLGCTGLVLFIFLTFLAYKCHYTKYANTRFLHPRETTLDRQYFSHKSVDNNPSPTDCLLKLNDIHFNIVPNYLEVYTDQSVSTSNNTLKLLDSSRYPSVSNVKPTSLIFVNESIKLPMNSLITENECMIHNNPISHVCHINVNNAPIDDSVKSTLSPIKVSLS